MDKTDILEKTHLGKVLASDSNYFRLVYKKTEKIVCAVFYILRSDPNTISHSDILVKDVEATAQKAMSQVLTSLHAPLDSTEINIHKVGAALIELESKLRILSAARMLPNDLLVVFLQEIDTVMRTLRNYSEKQNQNPLFSDIDRVPTQRLRSSNQSSGAGRTLEGRQPARMTVPSRKDRIIAILKDKGQATIKDVSEVITDCSEKTLQRELNALIDNGVVLREGERRWSKYSLI